MTGDQVMVTGGAGFVGSHLVEALLPNHIVHVFDVMPLAEATNLKECRDHPNLRYVQGDLRSEEDLQRFWVDDAKLIYHLASIVGIKNYLEDPLKLIDISVIGTRRLLGLAEKRRTKVLFSSTSEIYGRNRNVPWTEVDDRVLGPTSVDRWCYSSAKAVCEHMLYGMRKKNGLPFTIVRLFNVYGPRQNPYFVVSQSIYRALRNDQPLLYDDGSMTRCFTFVDDAVRGITAAAESRAADGEAFNIGNSVETTIRDVVDTVLQEVRGPLTSQQFDTQQQLGKTYEDIPRRVPDVTKAERVLGWRATVQIPEGIRRTVHWSRENSWWLSDGRNK